MRAVSKTARGRKGKKKAVIAISRETDRKLEQDKIKHEIKLGKFSSSAVSDEEYLGTVKQNAGVVRNTVFNGKLV